ncbi:MAG: DUF86 domain-containing protein [Bryobacterales bacterium]|nr:DUF86 domain-containing protein [Bryobacterales bacterium]
MHEDACGGKDVVFASPTLQDAIARDLQVMCESTQRLMESSKMRHPEVDWRGISGLRNVSRRLNLQTSRSRNSAPFDALRLAQFTSQPFPPYRPSEHDARSSVRCWRAG